MRLATAGFMEEYSISKDTHQKLKLILKIYKNHEKS